VIGWLKGLLKIVVLVPLVAALVLLAVANRGPVTLILDPFAREAPSIVYALPLYLLVFATLGLGIVVGGIAAWFAQAPHRRLERQHRREAEQLRTEIAKLRQTADRPAIDRKAA
jgi:hypothetical protein